MTRTILIVDDIKTNREILKNILDDEYLIVEATQGREAVDILNSNYSQFSAVLLDLSMPVMDGYEVLSYLKSDNLLSQIPVIVMTGQTDSDSEEKALKLGAKDYLSKPYKPAIIKQRIRNTIMLRETAATVNALQRDRLTGLYSRETFFEKVDEMVRAHEPGYFVMTCFDVNNFKVINDQYGTEKGDKVLHYIADVFRNGFEPNGGICCRIMADNFAIFYPFSLMDSDLLKEIRKKISTFEGIVSPITFSIGRYIINDLSLSPSAMYDRASLAQITAKGRYDNNIALYDESMRVYVLNEQKIVSEMDLALKERQFEVWFQPQYNHTTGARIGAEALARWRHPESGLIPPNAFISIFEKNGFIYELDKFIWEESCRYLRKWIDEGRNPLPISVNISRYDIFRPDLVEILKGLVKKYNLSVELLRLEITESAFAKSMHQIVKVVKELIEFGFTVEIDDFGSGYSSLNTLKNVPAQVVKLDMRFLDDGDDSQRGGNILESIVRMAKWLGMSVIAEGVESKEQADLLKSIGCNYVQGYLYAIPMTAADYERHCKGECKEERLLTMETVENLDSNAFWSSNSMDTLIFNSYVGAACICEYAKGKIEILRATDKYAHMLGGAEMTVDDVLKLDFSKHMVEGGGVEGFDAIERLVSSKDEITGEFLFADIPGCPREIYLRSTMRVIASTGSRYLIYCISENITAQRLAEQNESKVIKQLQAVMDNVNCGITAVTVIEEEVKYLLTNDKYYELLGYTRQQYYDEVGNSAFTTIYEQDRLKVSEVVERVKDSGDPTIIEFRALRRDGSVIWLRCSMSMTSFAGVDEPVQLATYTNVTSEKQAAQDLLDNLPCGAALYEYDGENISSVHLNKRYWELVDRTPVNHMPLSVMDAIHPDDRESVIRELVSAVHYNRDAACDMRLRHGKGGYRTFHIVGRIIPNPDGKYYIYASYAQVSDEAVYIREMLPVALKTVMAAQTDFSFIKDKNLRYICCSRSVFEAAGLESESEIIGKTDYDILGKDIADKFHDEDCLVMESGESIIDYVDLIPSSCGTKRYSSTSKFPLKDSQGNIIGIYGVGRDITQDRTMQSRMELLMNNIPGGIAVYEGQPDELDKIRLTYFSDGFCRLFGYTREEYEKLAEENALGLVFAEDLPHMMSQVKALVKKATPLDFVYRARINGGGYKWINIKAVLGEPREGVMSVNAVLFDVTSRQEALELLRMSEEENRLAIQHSQNVVCRYDVASRLLKVSPSANEIYNVESMMEDVPYSQVKEGCVSPETSEAYINFYESIMRGEKSGDLIYQRKSRIGWRWLEAHFSTIFSDGGIPVSAVISFTDMTERFEKDAAYKKWQQSLHDKEPESYSLFRCNLSKRTANATAEGSLLNVCFERGGLNFDERTKEYVEKYVAKEDAERFSSFVNINSLIAGYYQGKRIVTLEYREKLKEGAVRWLRLTVDLVEHPHSSDVEAYLLFENIDESKRAELITIARAETDPLTGVFNRTTFSAKVNRLLSSSDNSQYALMMLDIDGFKQVNDVFGHSAGDQALIDLAESLRAAIRHGDLVGRLGGDEFVILLKDIPVDTVAANKAKQICALTRKSFSAEVEISGSVGIAVAPRDGTDFDTLYKKADRALYYVKGSGKDNYSFYHEDMADEHLKPEEDDSEKSEASTVNGKRRRMLIVDDSAIDHEMLSKIFSDDFIVDKAKDGSSALIRLRHYTTAISVVLLDLMMPGMDGFAVLDKMQQCPELRNIPVIVVSGDGNRESSLKAIRRGATDFVTKPVDPALLRIRVQSAVSKAENERLRAKNSFLEYQNSEIMRYRTILERNKTVVVEHDWLDGSFTYDPDMSSYIAGTFDERKLWYILLTDLVADTDTVKKMQCLVLEMASDRDKEEDSITVELKTPSGERHWFRMCVYKVNNEFGLAGKFYLTFNDVGTSKPEQA